MIIACKISTRFYHKHPACFLCFIVLVSQVPMLLHNYIKKLSTFNLLGLCQAGCHWCWAWWRWRWHCWRNFHWLCKYSIHWLRCWVHTCRIAFCAYRYVLSNWLWILLCLHLFPEASQAITWSISSRSSCRNFFFVSCTTSWTNLLLEYHGWIGWDKGIVLFANRNNSLCLSGWLPSYDYSMKFL